MNQVVNPIKKTFHHLIALTIIQGSAFITFGILSIFYPKILAYLAAAIFILVGLTSILLGLKILGFYKKAESFFQKLTT